jgi:sec-independent protein translocase protein TatA
MGIEGISPFRLLIILAIVLVLFGGKRLRTLGEDLGGAIRGFKNAMQEGEQDADAQARRVTQQTPPTSESAERDQQGV